MPKKRPQFRVITFAVLAFLVTLSSLFLTQSKLFHYSPPETSRHTPKPTNSKAVESNAQSQLSEFQCIETQMNKYIQQLTKGDSTAFDTLVKCSSKAVPPLSKALKSEDTNLRIAVITALGEIGKKSAPALPLLNKLLKDINPDVRVVTIYALEPIGKDAVPALITALQDKNSDVRLRAVEALGQIGKEAKDAVPDLITALQDKNSYIRSSAADTLGQIGKDAKNAVPALITILQDKNSDVRLRVVEALGKIGKDAKDAVPALITALQDKDSDIRWPAVYALGQIGEDAKDAVPKIAEILLNPNESLSIRDIASQALEKIGSIDALSILEKNKLLIADIRKKVEEEKKKVGIPVTRTSRVRVSTTTYINKKPPLICKISRIRELLSWKCPQLIPILYEVA